MSVKKRDTAKKALFVFPYRAHQCHYEQLGDMQGNINIDGADYSLSLNVMRDHTHGSTRDWRLMHRYGIQNFTTKTGFRYMKLLHNSCMFWKHLLHVPPSERSEECNQNVDKGRFLICKHWRLEKNFHFLSIDLQLIFFAKTHINDSRFWKYLTFSFFFFFKRFYWSCVST